MIKVRGLSGRRGGRGEAVAQQCVPAGPDYPATPRLVSSPGKHGMGISLGKRWYLGAQQTKNRIPAPLLYVIFCDLG